MRLYVGNLPFKATEGHIQDFFAASGVAVDAVTVVRDKFTGEARGFGFVDINDSAAGDAAIQACNGRDLMGRTLVINEARPMTPNGGGERRSSPGGDRRGSGSGGFRSDRRPRS
ncbi:MAG: RNA-binding protein [Bryobacterales bacterium]|nr:RNA-binding protein [Bryobacterales bacterium]